MDGPERIARDLALLATTNPEAFWSALHELHDALAKAAHPDAELLALGVELQALCEAVVGRAPGGARAGAGRRQRRPDPPLVAADRRGRGPGPQAPWRRPVSRG